MSQPDGSYPRLNGALLATNKYNNLIASLVGQFGGSGGDQFVCCDGATIQLDSSAAEIDHIPHGTIVEIVGQVQGPTQVAVRCCVVLLVVAERVVSVAFLGGIIGRRLC